VLAQLQFVVRNTGPELDARCFQEDDFASQKCIEKPPAAPGKYDPNLRVLRNDFGGNIYVKHAPLPGATFSNNTYGCNDGL
jgi:hypothetical protein